MKYPNAAKGVKQLYYAAILSIILLAVTIVVILLSIPAGDEGILVAFIGLLGIAIVIVSIACLIYQVLGAYNASKDNPTFMNALYFLIGAIVASAISTFAGGVFGAVIGLIKGALQAIATYLIFTGIIELATNLKNNEMVGKGTKYRLINLVAAIVSVVVDFVSGVLPVELNVISSLLSAAATIISIFALILYFFYLKESVVMLETAKAEPKAEEPMDEEPKEEAPAEEKSSDEVSEEEPKDESNLE